MVALDSNAVSGRPPLAFPKISLPGWIALAAAGVALGSLAARGFSDNGLRLASQNSWRFACLVLFAAMMAGPLGRLIPRLHWLEADSCKLFLGFCASYGVYLLAVVAPNVLGMAAAAEGDFGASLFVLFGAGVTLVMALSLTPRMAEVAGGRARRALLTVSTFYFWLCYAAMGLAYISRPHRPDDFYGLSLCLMLVALLTRFADRFMAEMRRRPV